MKTFTDSTGKEWKLSLTLGSAKRVRESLDINLLEPEAGKPPLVERLMHDDELIAGVLYSLCKPQIDTIGMTPEQFAELLDGPTMAVAYQSFHEEMICFFTGRGQSHRAKIFEKAAKIIDLAIKKADQKLDAVNPQEFVEQTAGNKSTPQQA
jgi:hypothetical protein